MSATPLIAAALEAVSKEFYHGPGPAIRAVDNVTLALASGRIMGILGTNGSGKTTLLKLIGGSLEPTSGSIRRAESDETRPDNRAARSVPLAIPEEFVADSSRTVIQTLMDVARARGLEASDARDYLNPYVSAAQLRTHSNHLVRELSDGHRTALAIACALIHNPALLLLDEPVRVLDIQTTDLLVANLKRLAHIQGTTIVVASSDPHLIQRLCDTVAILHNGQLITAQPVHTLQERFSNVHYQIRFEGQVDAHWQDWFDGLSISWDATSTILSGIIMDQAALHGVLMRVRDLNLPLVSVNRVPPDLQAVYMQLLHTHESMQLPSVDS